MKKFLFLSLLCHVSMGIANTYSVDTCYHIEKNLQIFDYQTINGCQRIPEGILLTFNKFQSTEDKDFALASAAIAFGQSNHSLAYQKYKMVITPNDGNTRFEISWFDAKNLNVFAKSNKNIDAIINKSALLFKDITPIQKSQNSLQENNIEKPTSYQQPIVRGLPPPPPKLK